MKKTEIFFPFEPVPKGRPKFVRATGRSYTPERTADYEEKIREYYKSHVADYYDTAIKVRLVFNMPIPKSTSKKNKELIATGMIKCTKRIGDADNLAKSVLDALNAVAYEDDCLITKLTIIKQYAIDENVGTEMVITEDLE